MILFSYQLPSPGGADHRTQWFRSTINVIFIICWYPDLKIELSAPMFVINYIGFWMSAGFANSIFCCQKCTDPEPNETFTRLMTSHKSAGNHWCNVMQLTVQTVGLKMMMCILQTSNWIVRRDIYIECHASSDIIIAAVNRITYEWVWYQWSGLWHRWFCPYWYIKLWEAIYK